MTRTLSLKDLRYPITSIIIKRSVIFNHISVMNYYTFIVPKKDNTYEIFKTAITDGKAEISVSELSPFMIALSDNETITTENVNKAPNNAQTSSIDIVLYSILALGSLVGITYILVSKKKKEIA